MDPQNKHSFYILVVVALVGMATIAFESQAPTGFVVLPQPHGSALTYSGYGATAYYGSRLIQDRGTIQRDLTSSNAGQLPYYSSDQNPGLAYSQNSVRNAPGEYVQPSLSGYGSTPSPNSARFYSAGVSGEQASSSREQMPVYASTPSDWQAAYSNYGRDNTFNEPRFFGDRIRRDSAYKGFPSNTNQVPVTNWN